MTESDKQFLYCTRIIAKISEHGSAEPETFVGVSRHLSLQSIMMVTPARLADNSTPTFAPVN
jgi:hypothetical protein